MKIHAYPKRVYGDDLPIRNFCEKQAARLRDLLLRNPRAGSFFQAIFLPLTSFLSYGGWPTTVVLLGAGLSMESGGPSMDEVYSKMKSILKVSSDMPPDTLYRELRNAGSSKLAKFCYWLQGRMSLRPSFSHLVFGSLLHRVPTHMLTTNWDMILEEVILNTAMGFGPYWRREQEIYWNEFKTKTQNIMGPWDRELERYIRLLFNEAYVRFCGYFSYPQHYGAKKFFTVFGHEELDRYEEEYFNFEHPIPAMVSTFVKLHGSPFYGYCPDCEGLSRWHPLSHQFFTKGWIGSCQLHRKRLEYKFLVDERIDVMDNRLIKYVEKLFSECRSILILGYSGRDEYFKRLILRHKNKAHVITPKASSEWNELSESRVFEISAFEAALAITVCSAIETFNLALVEDMRRFSLFYPSSAHDYALYDRSPGR